MWSIDPEEVLQSATAFSAPRMLILTTTCAQKWLPAHSMYTKHRVGQHLPGGSTAGKMALSNMYANDSSLTQCDVMLLIDVLTR